MKSNVSKAAVLLLAVLSVAALSCCTSTEPAAVSEPGEETGKRVEKPEEGCARNACDPTSINIYSRNPAPGDFILLSVGPGTAGARVRFNQDHSLTASPPYESNGYTYFILGAEFQTLPGSHTLQFTLEHSDGTVRQLEEALEISYPDFDSISFNMPPGLTDGWCPHRLADDRERVRRARLHTESYPLWNRPFVAPLEGRISSRYGSIRIINQNPPSHHAGIDYAVVTGTPVKATNAGIVRLAASLLAYGNVVIIDHGLDLSSSYLHLDTMAVTEGDIVSRGQLIGTVGSTGFSTGPHLHWEINLGLQPVNPLQLTEGHLNPLLAAPFPELE